MSNYNEILSFPDPWYVSDISASREFAGGPLTLRVKCTDDTEVKSFVLVRPDDEDCVNGLLDAERISITKEVDSQREYGTIRVECFGESYAEFWCDKLDEIT